MPLLQISIVPVGTSTASFSSSVSKAVQIIDRKGLNYQVTPTSTVIEGELGQLMEVAEEIHKSVINQADRIITNITIDDRTDKKINMNNQVEIVK